MPTALVRRLNLDLIYPPFLEAYLETIARCRDRGAHYHGLVGYRSAADQLFTWTEGRTRPGTRKTNAGPYQSLHQYGLAIDACRDGDLVHVGLQPEWGTAGYDVLKEEGERRSLEVGVPSVSGGDPGHVQYPLCSTLGRKEADVCAELERVWKNQPPRATEAERMKAVWARVDALLAQSA